MSQVKNIVNTSIADSIIMQTLLVVFNNTIRISPHFIKIEPLCI